MTPLTPEEANRRLAARLGVPFDEQEHAPADLSMVDGLPVVQFTEAAPGPDFRDDVVDPETVLSGSSPDDIASGQSSESRLTEAGMDTRDSALATNQWRMLGTRVTQKRTDLTLMDQLQMLRLARKLWDSNPLAQRLLKRMVNYVAGEGISVSAKDKSDEKRKKIQEVIDKTWDDHRNNLEVRLPRWFLSQRTYGELCLNTAVNKHNGLVRFASVSPFQIAGVFTEREDVEHTKVVAVGRENQGLRPKLLHAVTVDEAGEVVRWLEALARAEREHDGDEQGPKGEEAWHKWAGEEAEQLREAAEVRLREELSEPTDPDLESHTIAPQLLRLTPPKDGESAAPKKNIPRRKGKVLYFGTNTITGMVRGRSDLLAIADMLNAFDQLMWLFMERRALANAFIWDVTITGANETQIDRWWDNNPPPEPGSIRVHNEREKWEAVTPDLKSQEESAAADHVLSYIANGAGFPKHWMGGNDDPNRASAVEMSTPTMKDMTALQREFKTIITEMFRFVIDQAVLHGQLPEDTPSDCFEVQMPDLSVSDTVKAASTFQAAMSAYMAGLQGGILDKEEVQEGIALLAVGLGHEIDLEKLRERVKQEEEKKQQAMDSEGAYGPNGPPPPPGLQGGPAPPGQPGDPRQGQPGLDQPGQLQRPTTRDGELRKQGTVDARGAGASRKADRRRLAGKAKEIGA